MIAVIDYGAGNIFSVKNTLDYLGIESKLTSDTDEIHSADKLILPGVGAFPEAMRMLSERGLVEVIKEEAQKKPLLGICLGMQMLFDRSYEFEECDGLGLIHGEVIKMESDTLAIPHMGWNKLEYNRHCRLTDGLGDDAHVYFVHSYKADCGNDSISAFCEYGGVVPAIVHDGGFVYGVQFHPEKSGKVGLQILRNFCDILSMPST